MSAVSFMVIGLPRSGTTWAANWLTAGEVFCAHDPLWTAGRRDLDRAVADSPAAVRGVSCTGLWRWPEFVNDHPARKLIVHRPASEVRRSMQRLGLPALPLLAANSLWKLNGMHVDHRELFDPAAAPALWAYLTGGLPFDAARHAMLRPVHVEPAFSRVAVRRDVVRKMFGERRARA